MQIFENLNKFILNKIKVFEINRKNFEILNSSFHEFTLFYRFF